MYYQFLQLYRNQYQQEQPPSEIYSKLHAEALATVTGVFHTRDLKRQLCKNVTCFFLSFFLECVNFTD